MPLDSDWFDAGQEAGNSVKAFVRQWYLKKYVHVDDDDCYGLYKAVSRRRLRDRHKRKRKTKRLVAQEIKDTVVNENGILVVD
tara:strand:+ start:118 stop:366 length:249 start_codon:yes stop_codon:yes gene_type:complete